MARASLSDSPEKSNTARNAAIAATVLLAPGGLILGSILIARAIKKRREAKEADGAD